MDHTLHRREERRERRSPVSAMPSVAWPAFALLASSVLAAGFVLVVSDLITRLG